MVVPIIRFLTNDETKKHTTNTPIVIMYAASFVFCPVTSRISAERGGAVSAGNAGSSVPLVGGRCNRAATSRLLAAAAALGAGAGRWR